MIVLGIDPGSRITGYGVLDLALARPRYVASGCIRIRSDDLAQKLAQVYAGVSELIAMYRPAEFAIEQVFMSRNADSALKLGQARGAAICAAAARGLAVSEYTATQVKQAIVVSFGPEDPKGCGKTHLLRHSLLKMYLGQIAYLVGMRLRLGSILSLLR